MRYACWRLRARCSVCQTSGGIRYLIHWPGVVKTSPESEGNARQRHESWLALQECREQGLVDAIGVSNFSIAQLESLRMQPGCVVPPAVNQIEVRDRSRSNAIQPAH